MFKNILQKNSYKFDYPIAKPTSAIINVVRRCNAKCAYCINWHNKKSIDTDPPIDDIFNILTHLKKLGIKFIVISGGEPLLRKDIFEILNYANRLDFKTMLVTNGSALTANKIELMGKSHLQKIGLSIDSLDKDRAQQLRGIDIKHVVRAMNLLIENNKIESDSSLNISLLVTITRYNIQDLLPLAQYAKRNGISIQFQPVHFAGSGLSEYILENLWPNQEEIFELRKIINSLIIGKKNLNYPIISRNEFLYQIPIFFEKKHFSPESGCTVAFTDIIIDTNFGVRPCWAMDPIDYITDKKNIIDIWYSNKMRKARRTIRLGKCPGCLYSCHINKSNISLPNIEDSDWVG
jgi:MoaA/NifB/PqqE/SkfB family radical SAM enzyme